MAEEEKPKKKGWPIADRAKDMENEQAQRSSVKDKFYVKVKFRKTK